MIVLLTYYNNSRVVEKKEKYGSVENCRIKLSGKIFLLPLSFSRTQRSKEINICVQQKVFFMHEYVDIKSMLLLT